MLGRMSPTPFMRSLIETVPRSLKLSIHAYATNLKSGTYKGAKAEICEGIDPAERGSVDVVTQAGAGGRVLALIESGYDRDHESDSALQEVPDDDLLAHLRTHRPYLLESKPDAPKRVEDQLEETEVPEETAPPTPSVSISDVLASDEFKASLNELVESRLEESRREDRALIESTMVPRRQVELRDLRTIAH